MIATLLDSVIIHALFARDVAGVTAEMTIRDLKSVTLIEPVQVTGRVVSGRHGVLLCHAELYQNETIAACASAKFMALAQSLKRESS